MTVLRLVSNAYRGYHTGMGGSFQILIGFLSPGLVLIRFDKDGRLIDAQDRHFSKDLLEEWVHPPVNPSEGNKIMRPRGYNELKRWETELGFTECPISVLPFTLEPRYPVELDYVPGSEREILANPDDYSPEEVDAAKQYASQWNEGFPYAFTWNEEFLIAPDGTVCST